MDIKDFLAKINRGIYDTFNRPEPINIPRYTLDEWQLLQSPNPQERNPEMYEELSTVSRIMKQMAPAQRTYDTQQDVRQLLKDSMYQRDTFTEEDVVREAIKGHIFRNHPRG